jgi:hypothetical protein
MSLPHFYINVTGQGCIQQDKIRLRREGPHIMTWKECGRKRSWHNISYYSGICQKGQGKTTKNLSGHVSNQNLSAIINRSNNDDGLSF